MFTAVTNNTVRQGTNARTNKAFSKRVSRSHVVSLVIVIKVKIAAMDSVSSSNLPCIAVANSAAPKDKPAKPTPVHRPSVVVRRRDKNIPPHLRPSLLAFPSMCP